MRISLRSLPSATARAISAAVMTPTGLPAWKSVTSREVRAGVLHQVGGRGDVVALGYCLGGQPHDVGDGGRGL